MGQFKSAGPNIRSYANPEVMHFNFLLELLIRTVSYQILDMKKLKLMHQLSKRILIVLQSAIYLTIQSNSFEGSIKNASTVKF